LAHFAEINSDNIVLRVVVISNSNTANSDGHETESIGATYCQNLLGGTWVQTSYNNNFRKRFAGIGFTYDSTRNAFIPPKPFNSWTLNETTCDWEAPVALPSDASATKTYSWNEGTTSWVED
tara:strand:+ start:14 stop:379 length:366 start_codon:yes stop_codon:yes gene_type:complete